MDTGTKISGLMHVGLITWVMVGGIFGPPDRPRAVQVADVSLISAEEFAALSRPVTAPPASPEPTPEAQPEPETPPQVPADTLPEPAPEPTDAPEPEAEAAPVPPPPTAEIPGPLTQPDTAPRTAPRPIDRVAPTPAPVPDPEARRDTEDRAAVAPEPATEPEMVEPETEPTAREEATTEIVTEATPTEDSPEPQRLTTAPSVSPRPQARPAAPAPQAAPQVAETQPTPPEPEPAPREEPPRAAEPVSPSADAVSDAIAQALSGSNEPQAPSGPPLTSGEVDGLRLAVESCWNVGALSTDALNVTVVIAVSMSREARPEEGSIRMVRASGGSDAAARQAFETARRAIIRCGVNGYGLPVEKYEHWREIEMTFNPEGMRLR